MHTGLNFMITLIVLMALPVMCFAETKEGAIALKESQFGPPEGVVNIEMGSTVKLVAHPYITDFFDTKVVTASATVKNTGSHPMFFVFSIAFFDRDGHLLGCTSQTTFNKDGLKPGQATQLSSCLVHMPPEVIPKISRFHATLYESQHKL